MSEQKEPYTTRFERLEGSRPPVRDDWGWQDDEAEDIGANPLDTINYREDSALLRGQIRLLLETMDTWRAEFRAMYVSLPPIFKKDWDGVARTMGVIE